MGSGRRYSNTFAYLCLSVLICMCSIKYSRCVHNHNFPTKPYRRSLWTSARYWWTWSRRFKQHLTKDCVSCSTFTRTRFSKKNNSYFLVSYNKIVNYWKVCIRLLILMMLFILCFKEGIRSAFWFLTSKVNANIVYLYIADREVGRYDCLKTFKR